MLEGWRAAITVGQMMAHSPGYPIDNNRQPDREERSREKQRGSRRGSLR